MDPLTINLFSSFQKFFLLLIPFLLVSYSVFCQDCNSSTSTLGIKGEPVAKIPFKISSGLISVKVRINGSKELSMYFDTGMSAPIVALFHKESIEEIGIKNTQDVFIGGAGGENQKPGYLAQGVTIQLANLKMPNQILIVMDNSRKNSPWQYDGIIGRTVLDSYLTQIDYETNTITLYDPSSVKIENSVSPPLPISLDLSGIPTIETKIDIDGKKNKNVKLILDLGNRNALYLHTEETKGINLPETTLPNIIGRGLQGEVSAKIGRIHEIKLGKYSLRDIPAVFLEPGTNTGIGADFVDGNVGELIFHRFNIIFDYKNKQMYLAPNKHFSKPFELDMAGFGFLEQDKDDIYNVRYVTENSPASEKDIRKGDKIISINGKDVREYDYYEVYDLLRQEGKEIKLTIERGNELFEKILRLRRLL